MSVLVIYNGSASLVWSTPREPLENFLNLILFWAKIPPLYSLTNPRQASQKPWPSLLKTREELTLEMKITTFFSFLQSSKLFRQGGIGM